MLVLDFYDQLWIPAVIALIIVIALGVRRHGFQWDFGFLDTCYRIFSFLLQVGGAGLVAIAGCFNCFRWRRNKNVSGTMDNSVNNCL